MYKRQESYNAVPDTLEESLDIRPDLTPARAEPAEEHVDNALDDADRCRKDTLDSLPYPGEDCLDARPHLRPVSGKQSDKYIQNASEHVQHRREYRSNRLKRTFKDQGKQGTETVPHCREHLCDVLETKFQSIQPVNDSLAEGTDGLFDGIPPVSYTHLDVHKRQSLDSFLFRTAAMTPVR